MKTASVREVQHHLSRILDWVEDGEEVTILRRKQVIAKIIPAREGGTPPEWPDFAARRKRLQALGWKGKALSKIVDEGRGERA
ncbi:MAG: type II toxin-antitoxin system Phd/YefM family antitoxin [Verrucomicrobiota bacterium]